jgi:hypothetical protein
MDKPRLNDPDQYPDDTVLAAQLGPAKAVWDELVDGAVAAVEGVELRWRYYRDGKAWLCRVTRKDKTICWVSVWDGFFKTTFYFREKEDEAIEQLDIDDALKSAYASSPNGKLRPLTVEVADRAQLPDLYTLMRCKAGGTRSR